MARRGVGRAMARTPSPTPQPPGPKAWKIEESLRVTVIVCVGRGLPSTAADRWRMGPAPAMERIIEARKRARGGFLGPLRAGQDRYVELENRWGPSRPAP